MFGGKGAKVTKTRYIAVAFLALVFIGGAASTYGVEFHGVRPLFPVWGHLYQGWFKSPSAVFLDRRAGEGEIYVADTGSNMVGIFNESGHWLFTFGNDGELKEPRSLAVDKEGRILVADNEGVKLFDYRGRFLGLFPFDEKEAKPKSVAIALDREDNLYFLDKARCRILVYSPEGRLIRALEKKGKGPDELVSPRDLAIDHSGRIYIIDAGGGTIIKVFDSRGRFLRGWGKRTAGPYGFSHPSGIALDSEGRVFVADSLRQAIKVFDTKGNYLGIFGGFGQGPGDVAYPADISIGANGRIYVVERVGRRLQAFERLIRIEGVAAAPEKEETREDVLRSLRHLKKRRLQPSPYSK
jgi:hypothetical protein